MKNFVRSVLLTGLLAGFLDALAAIIQFLIKGGKDPAVIFKYIASGVYGREALKGGNSYVIQGIIFHFLVALLFTVCFYWIYPKVRWFATHKILTAILFGIVTWLVMNLLVLPLSHTPPVKIQVKQALIAIGILAICIGLPVSFMANKYYLYRK